MRSGGWRAAANTIIGWAEAKETFAIGAGSHCTSQSNNTYKKPTRTFEGEPGAQLPARPSDRAAITTLVAGQLNAGLTF